MLSSVMNLLHYISFSLYLGLVSSCGPGRGPIRRRGPRKILPLIYKQHEPNFSERALAASGLPDGKISREDSEFRKLVPNYNPDIIFKDEEGTGADRIMTQRCKEKLNTLAISVMNQWAGLRLRVTEGWDEESHHTKDSLHYEGRAVDITTSDRDRSKYGLLASLAVEAGFDWVYYESRSHVHASCRAESAEPGKNAGCFPSDSRVKISTGETILMSQLRVGDSVQAVNTAGELVYSEVLLFLDRDPEQVKTFLNLETESGSVLSLTSSHLVHVSTSCTELSCFQATYAGSVEPGHFILVSENSLHPEKVVKVSVSRLKGVYAPLTYTGTLVVENIVASSYAIIDNQSIAHASFAPVRWATILKSNLKHLWVSMSSLSTSEPRTERSVPPNGVHWYANMLYTIAGNILPNHLVSSR